MLAGAGLGDHARLAHAPRQQRLADGVVDLVGAGVVEVLALEVDLRAAEFARQARGVVDRARPADEVRQFMSELGDEGRDRRGSGRRPPSVRRGRGSASRRRTAAVGSEVPARVGLVIVQACSGGIRIRRRRCGHRPRAPASQNRRIAAASLMPLADSTPGAHVNGPGRRRRMPSVTFAACNPPDKTTRQGTVARDETNRRPFRPAVARDMGVEQQAWASANCRRIFSKSDPASCAPGAQDGPARGPAFGRRLVAVELQDEVGNGLDRASDLVRIGVDEQATGVTNGGRRRAGPPRADRDVAGARRIEHEPDRVGAGLDGIAGRRSRASVHRS